MSRVRRVFSLVVCIVSTVGFLCLARDARAQASRPQSIHVLGIDSEDAYDQADALTAALRSRVRSSPGWVLLDTTQSLGMLTAALRCPTRPDAACLQRIGDLLKTDRFIWGLISRAPGNQVTADIHLWQRGKPDQSVKETYSDNLRDQNDDILRKIAARFFDRLTGGAGATVVVHVAASGAPGAPIATEGTVVADASQRANLDHGTATLVVTSGSHSLDVQAPGYLPFHQTITTVGGTTQEINVELAPVALVAPPAAAPTSRRRTIALAALIGGGVVLAAGAVLGITFEAERAKLNSDAQNNYSTDNKMQILDPCNPTIPQTPNAFTQSGCSALHTAHALEVPAIIMIGVGAVGVATGAYLLGTEQKEGSPPPPATASWLRDVRILPSVGSQGGSIALSAAF